MARALSNPVRVSAPLQGVDGRTVLAKARAPLVTDGRIGDFWIDTVAKKLYGPKNAGGWPDNGLIKGDRGWVPVLAAVTDGTRRVHRVVDWSGGEGVKPATGSYVGAAGLVPDIADAVDMRGPGGPAMLIDALTAGGDDVSYDDNAAIAKVGDDNERQPLKRLLGAGGLLQFDSVADAQALVVPASVKAVQINGADGAAGGAGHIRRRVDSEPAIGPKHRSADRFTSDGSSDAANGGWWAFVEDRAFLPAPAVNFIRGIGDKLRDVKHIKDFDGFDPAGATDGAEALNYALSRVYADGAGDLVIDGTGKYLLGGEDILVPENCGLKGPWKKLGEKTARDYSGVQGLRLASNRTIRFNGRSGSIEGLMIIRAGMTAPTTMRQAKDLVASYAGTAISFGDGVTSNQASDCYVGHSFIAGFNQAIYCSHNERPKIEACSFDNRKNIYLDWVTDKNRISHCDAWNYLTCRINPISYAVSGAVNNGSGKVRLTIPAHQVAVGDYVNVVNVGGTTEANGRQLVTAVAATTIDLDVNYVNAYSSGGVVYLHAWQRERHIQFGPRVDWGYADFCFAFGYDVAFDVAGSDFATFQNCEADNFVSLQDPVSIGVKFGANARAGAFIGGVINSHGRGVVIDPQYAFGEQDGAFLLEGNRFRANITNDIHQITGRAVVTGNQFAGARKGANINVDPNSGGGVYAHNDGRGSLLPISISGQALRLSTIGPNNWPDVTVGEHRSYSNTVARLAYDYFGPSGIEFAGRTHRGTAAAPEVSLENDRAYRQSGWFFDGANSHTGVAIDFELDGTPGANDVPGRIVFRTALDGTAALVERMRLDNAGRLSIGTTAPSTDALLTLAGAQGTSQAIALIGFGADADAAIVNTNGVLSLKTGSSATVAGMQDRLQVKTTGAIRLVPISSDPSSPVDGDIWINSTAGKLRARIGGVTVDLN